MRFSCGFRLCGSDQLHSMLRNLSRKTFAVALLVVVLNLFGVLLALGEHGVDETGKLVGGGRDGLGTVPFTNGWSRSVNSCLKAPPSRRPLAPQPETLGGAISATGKCSLTTAV